MLLCLTLDLCLWDFPLEISNIIMSIYDNIEIIDEQWTRKVGPQRITKLDRNDVMDEAITWVIMDFPKKSLPEKFDIFIMIYQNKYYAHVCRDINDPIRTTYAHTDLTTTLSTLYNKKLCPTNGIDYFITN